MRLQHAEITENMKHTVTACTGAGQVMSVQHVILHVGKCKQANWTTIPSNIALCFCSAWQIVKKFVDQTLPALVSSYMSPTANGTAAHSTLSSGTSCTSTDLPQQANATSDCQSDSASEAQPAEMAQSQQTTANSSQFHGIAESAASDSCLTADVSQLSPPAQLQWAPTLPSDNADTAEAVLAMILARAPSESVLQTFSVRAGPIDCCSAGMPCISPEATKQFQAELHSTMLFQAVQTALQHMSPAGTSTYSSTLPASHSTADAGPSHKMARGVLHVSEDSSGPATLPLWDAIRDRPNPAPPLLQDAILDAVDNNAATLPGVRGSCSCSAEQEQTGECLPASQQPILDPVPGPAHESHSIGLHRYACCNGGGAQQKPEQPKRPDLAEALCMLLLIAPPQTWDHIEQPQVGPTAFAALTARDKLG